MQKIKLLSRILSFLFFLFAAVIPLIHLAAWTFIDELLATPSLGYMLPGNIQITPELIQAAPTLTTQILGYFVTMVPGTIGMFIFFMLGRLFQLYAHETVFEHENVRLIKRTGYLYLLSVAISPFYQAAITLVMTMNNPPGSRMISIGLNSDVLGDLVIALVIIVAAHIMEESRKMHEEVLHTI